MKNIKLEAIVVLVLALVCIGTVIATGKIALLGSVVALLGLGALLLKKNEAKENQERS